MKIIVRFAVLASLVAVPVMAQDVPVASLATKSGVIGNPPSGRGQVVFFRPGSIMGMALGCTVHEGSDEIARLGSGKYFVVPAAPGKHVYSTRGEKKDELNLEIESGETYFVKCNIGAGIAAGRANLSPSDQSTFAKKAKGLKLWSGADPKPD